MDERNKLNPIEAKDALDQIHANLDHVVRYGLPQMDRMDAEKIVTALTLTDLLRKAYRS